MNFLLKKTSLLSVVLYLVSYIGPSELIAQNRHDEVNLNKIPPRIIRACCAFGYDLKLWGIPFVSIDQVISIDDLEMHQYMGDKKEGVGTIYTKKGGFIDLGHVRDQIDWTRFLYATILNSQGKGEVVLPLRREAGQKSLRLSVPAELSKSDCILIAGKIAYDFSLWHEISTWYGASTIPFIPEKFSSFSVEDVYSNLLGVHIGMKTLHSRQPFNEAATKLLSSTLDSLGAVATAKETYDAYDAIHNKWYTNRKRIPSSYITLKRDRDVLDVCRPWVLPRQSNVNDLIRLEVPRLTTQKELLTNYYQFTIDLNHKIPVDQIFPDKVTRVINQNDFEVILDTIAREIELMEEKMMSKKK